MENDMDMFDYVCHYILHLKKQNQLQIKPGAILKEVEQHLEK